MIHGVVSSQLHDFALDWTSWTGPFLQVAHISLNSNATIWWFFMAFPSLIHPANFLRTHCPVICITNDDVKTHLSQYHLTLLLPLVCFLRLSLVRSSTFNHADLLYPVLNFVLISWPILELGGDNPWKMTKASQKAALVEPIAAILLFASFLSLRILSSTTKFAASTDIPPNSHAQPLLTCWQGWGPASTSPCQLLDYLWQDFFQQCISETTGLLVSCWVALPADTGWLKSPMRTYEHEASSRCPNKISSS